MNNILGIDRKSLLQAVPTDCRGISQRLNTGPWRLRIDMVQREGRYTAPVIDSRQKQQRIGIRTQIRRRLKVHIRAEDQTRDRHGPEQIQERRLRMISRSEEHTSELQSPLNLVCRLLLE